MIEGLYDKIVRPLMFRLDPETAHETGIGLLRFGLGTRAARRALGNAKPATEPVERFGLRFSSPVGLAAGFDKNGLVVNQLAALGFGFVEVGTVTHRPQKGNERPRLFRLPDDGALVNRLGFNNDGAEKVAARLAAIRRECVVGVNIGKNRDVPIEAAIPNYLAAFDIVRGVADYVAVNVSSPNTPNLRELQKSENLDELLAALTERNREAGAGSLPILLKIAPDLTDAEIDGIVETAFRHGISGLIATNTTISRSGLRTPCEEQGGLSGRPLREMANRVISGIYRASGGRIPIVGVGGVFSAEDAFEKIAAGASLVQAYTGFVYGGPCFARNLNRGLESIVRERGFASLDEAVGSAAATKATV